MLDVGATIGDYRLDRRIGRGGMGVVFRATQLSLARPVALKVIAPELAEDPDFRKRFKREALLAARIDHPNIVPVYQADEVDGHLFIAMRFVPGTDLRDHSILRGQLDPAEATRIVEQVAAALDAAHEAGLVHRDVKPANVLLSGKAGAEHVYLSDFGLTKRIASQADLTRSGGIVGTLDYIAPEQLKGGPIDGRADVYALGCVLYELLTAMVPFDRDSEAAKLFAHVSEPPPRPSDVLGGLAAGFDPVIRKAMAKDPDDRFPTAGELAQAARDALSADPAAEAPTRVPAITTTTRRPDRRTPAPDATRTPVPAPMPGPVTAEPPAPAKPRGPRVGRRAGALVAVVAAGAVAAVIGFASGGPSGAGAAEAHARAVGTVCTRSNAVQKARLARVDAFASRLGRLHKLASVRDHVLRETELRLAASTDLRSRLVAAPPAPPEKAAAQRDTLAAWERNLARLRKHRDALADVSTYRGLFRVLARQPRRAIETDSTAVITGMLRLGGSSCDLDPLAPDPPVRVNAPTGQQSEPVMATPPRALPSSPRPRQGSARVVPPPAQRALPPAAASPDVPPQVVPPPALAPPPATTTVDPPAPPQALPPPAPAPE